MARLAALLWLLSVSRLLAGETGVVVSVSPPATQVGMDILARGGNAVDAAVATGFALAVTWPEAGNIGGGGFMLIRPPGKDGEAVVVDYRETAPAGADRNLFVRNARKPHLTVGVPGSVAGMALAHARLGKLPWKSLVEPAIRLADEGFLLDAGAAASLNEGLGMKDVTPEMRRVLGRENRTWNAGDRLVQKDLARTLRRIDDQGADGFYKGETADRLVADMREKGGLITRDDLANYRAKLRRPLRGTYRDHEILVPPPPSGGGIALLLALNLLEPLDLRKEDRYSARTLHLMTEALRRAFADRARHLGDADFVTIPDRLISRDYARSLLPSLALDRATRSETLAPDIPLAGEKPNTTHYSVIDGQGMAVSTTTTLEESFGSRIMVPGAGFLLNNEMTDFNPQPGVTTRKGQVGTPANLIAPGKRMLSSMTPTIVVRDGRTVLVTGSPGGRTIISTVLGMVVNRLEYRMSLEEAVAAPRLHHQWFPDRLQVEEELARQYPEAIRQLKDMGHDVQTIRVQGDAHSIGWDGRHNRYEGVKDRRRAGRPAF